jgi:hypothetical protein
MTCRARAQLQGAGAPIQQESVLKAMSREQWQDYLLPRRNREQ